MADRKLEQQKSEQRALIEAYKVCFGTPEGKKVLKDLETTFLWQDSRPHVAHGNSLGVTYIDAQRMLIRSIRKKVDEPLDDQLAMYDVPVELEQGDPLSDANRPEHGQSRGYI